MARHCNSLCDHLPHVRSLRWVTGKRKYKRCYKCDKYFKAPPTQIRCECCADTLRVYYKLPTGRSRTQFDYTIHYLLNQSDILLKRLIHYWTKGAPRTRKKPTKEQVRRYNKKYYKTHRHAKTINTLNSLSIDNGRLKMPVLQEIRQG